MALFAQTALKPYSTLRPDETEPEIPFRRAQYEYLRPFPLATPPR